MKTKNKLRIIIDGGGQKFFEIALLLNKVIIGICKVEVTEEGFYITLLEIAKDLRCKGYGKYLLTESIKILKDMNKYDFNIELIAYPYQSETIDPELKHKELLRLVKFYGKFGFKTLRLRSDSAPMLLKIIRY